MDYWRPLPFQFDDKDGLMGGVKIASLAGVEGIGYSQVECLSRCGLRGKPGGGPEVRRHLFSLAEVPDEYSIIAEMVSADRLPLASLSLERPRIMGVLNVTPDSFFDGGQHIQVSQAVERGLKMVEEGADIIDIGGESTRPGAELVSIEDELERVIPVIEALRSKSDVIISIDTRKSEVMTAAVQAGTNIINDVSALTFDPNSLGVAASLNVPVILMHAQGTPEVMQENPSYNNVVLDVYDYLSISLQRAVEAGVRTENIILDPGIGFGKSVSHNCELLKALSLFHGLGVPLLLGCSRKSFIGALSRNEKASERLPGSLAAVMLGASQGVQIFRVHDVAETVQALKVWGCKGR